MRAARLVLVRLVQRSLPLAADALVPAGGRPLLALVLFVALQRFAGVLFAAELALAGQLGDGLLDGQIAAGRRLGDLHAAVRTGGHLVAQSVFVECANEIVVHGRKQKKNKQEKHSPAVRQQMGETGGAHQMTHLTLGDFRDYRLLIAVVMLVG